MIEQALYSVLSGAAAVAAIVGTRIEPTNSQQASTLPRIVYERTAAEYEQTLLGSSSGLCRATYDFDCIASTYSGVKTLAAAVRSALDRYKGNQTGSGYDETIYRVMLDDDTDEFEPPRDGSDRGDYVVRMTFEVWYGVTVPN
jgi:hypothetical protein